MNAISPYLGIGFYSLYFILAVYFLRKTRLDPEIEKVIRILLWFLAIASPIAVVMCILDIKGVW